MTKDYDKIKKQLIEYYQDLLIAQYHDKPKAREIVKANIEEELCNLLEQKVKDAFDVDTAVGVQLDIIGKWVGIERIFKGQKYDNQAWFSLPKYNQKTNSFMHGFSTYATFEEEGGFLTYDFILGTKNKLNDNDFRMLIKLKIIRNNVPHSPKPIDDAMYKLFADTLYTVWNEIAYDSNAFTVVGSPTITEDGVASGFSGNNYIKIGEVSQPNNNFKAKIKIKTSTLPDTGHYHFINSNYNIGGFSMKIDAGGKRFICYLSSDGQGNDIGTLVIPMDVSNNTDYWLNLSWDGQIYEFSCSTDGINFSNKIIKESNLPIYTQNRVYSLGGSSYPFICGSIDLKHFLITVDGKEVFNGGYNQPMEMTFYYNPKRYGIVKLGQEKNCFPIPTGVKANFVEVKR